MILHFMKQWHCTAFSLGLSLVGHLPTLTNLSRPCGVLAKVILVQRVVVTRVAQAGLLNTQHITSDTQMSRITAHQILWQDVIVFFELASSHLSRTSHVSQWISMYMYVCIYIYLYLLIFIFIFIFIFMYTIHKSYPTYPCSPHLPKTLSWRYLAFAASQVRWFGKWTPWRLQVPTPWNVRLKTSTNAGDVRKVYVEVKLNFQSQKGMPISTEIFRHIA